MQNITINDEKIKLYTQNKRKNRQRGNRNDKQLEFNACMLAPTPLPASNTHRDRRYMGKAREKAREG